MASQSLGKFASVQDIDDHTFRELLITASTNARPDELGSITLVEDQELAVELPLISEPPGMYVRYDSPRCPNQHWGTAGCVAVTKNLAFNWWKRKGTPTLHIGDLSARVFADTKCHSAHKSGTHVDCDLPGTLPEDGEFSPEKRKKCCTLLWFAIQLGVRRALFSDALAADVVNQLAAKYGFAGRVVVRADHDNHFHLEL